MKDFIIYFLANTGSSAIISHLMKFRDIINILGFEPFDQHNMKKKKLVSDNLEEIFRNIFDKSIDDYDKLQEIYSHHTDRKFPQIDKKKSVGFKMRFRNWDTIKHIIKENGVVVFILIRQNVFRWALSLYDKQSNQFKLIKKKIEKNPKIYVDIDKFREILYRCENNLNERYELIEKLEDDNYEVYPLFYEDYCDNKLEFFKDFFNSLEIPISNNELEKYVKIPNYFKKVHDDDIRKFVINYDELKEEFGNKYEF